jgi:hypothetical protein
VRHADGRITAHDHAKVGAALADTLLLRLQFPDELRQRIVWAIRHHTFHHSWNLRPGAGLTRRQQAFLADDRFPLLLEFLRIDTLASQGHSRRMNVYAFYRELWQAVTTGPPAAGFSG